MRFLVIALLVLSFNSLSLNSSLAATRAPSGQSTAASSGSGLPVTGMVVTTHPLYLIAQAVTQGIEKPVLLLPPNQSGHDVQLRPADRQRLKQANFVLWFGAQYEAPLASVLKGQPNAMALFDLKAFKRLPLRDAQGKIFANSLDPHLWLEPANAVGIAHAIAAVRARQFPQYASRYQHNAQAFGQRLMAQANQYRSPVARPYWAYHDAYQYLERSLNLNFKGSLTVEHDLPPTIRQLAWLQQQRPQLKNGTIYPMCLLAEGHADPATLKRLHPVKVQTIDEIMSGEQDFVVGWQKLAQDIAVCVKT
ncbi:metal ABC transporter solute-binding protein, Zn/Mn family [Alkanindiges hydrocarboniclasticus]|nr:zinc ABC transporter substrate-binding protein [Alkanindiges hydrocarboniclasticus]